MPLSHSKDDKLNFWMLTMLVTGNMVGSGVFLLPADLARFGSISLLGWVFTAMGAVLLAWTFSRLSLLVPNKSGGPYVYAKAGLGEFIGFQAGYCYWLAIWIGNAAIALAAIGYLHFFITSLGGHIPRAFAAIFLVWLLTYLNTISVRVVGVFQIVTTVLKILPLVIIILFGWDYFNLDNDKKAPSQCKALYKYLLDKGYYNKLNVRTFQ